MALTQEKILKIIEKEKHITVKITNSPLQRVVEKMVKDGLLEFADTYRDCVYYRKAGSDWRFFNESDPRY